MEAIIDAIRAALAKDATPEVRAAGIAACRSALAALEPAAARPPIDAAGVAHVVAALRGAPPDQLLDLAIAKLRSIVPPNTELPPVQPINFHLVPVRKRGG
jgi:hypothetical protein